MERLHELLESLAVLCQVDRIGRCPDDWRPGGLELPGELQGRLPAVLYDHPLRLFLVDNLHDILERQGLEIQPVGGVVIRRNRLGIAIDHDRFIARLTQCQRGMYATVVELDALPDAVRATAQDHYLRRIRRLGFTLFFIRRVHVRGRRGELGGTSVHALEHGPDAELEPATPHRKFLDIQQCRYPRVRKSFAL